MLHGADLGGVQATRYDEDGYLGPFRALPTGEAEHLADAVVASVLGSDAGQLGPAMHCRHLDSQLVLDLCSLTPVLDRVMALLGPNVVLWRSHFWCKNPGDPAVAWHQDLTHWPLEPMINVTAWLALDPARAQNGCVQVVPGSHMKAYPTEALRGDPLTDAVQDDYIDRGRVLDMELAPGECFLFSEKLLHASPANNSAQRRLGFATRFTTPAVRITGQEQMLGGRHQTVLVRGADRHRVNRTTSTAELVRRLR